MDRIGLAYNYKNMSWKHKGSGKVFSLQYLNSKDDSELQAELFKVTGFVLDDYDLDIMRKPPVQLNNKVEEKHED